MWRYAVLNLCFIALVITLLSIQHSVPVFGPSGRIHAITETDPWRALGFESLGDLHTPAKLRRAAALLHDAWRRGMVVREWSMEYRKSPWQILNPPNGIEADLLEARYHVANAGVFAAATHENNRALAELARAEKSIETVQNLVQPSLAPRITRIRDEIVAAESRERTDEEAAVIRFEAIQADIDHLLAVVRSSNPSEKPARHAPLRG